MNRTCVFKNTYKNGKERKISISVKHHTAIKSPIYVFFYIMHVRYMYIYYVYINTHTYSIYINRIFIEYIHACMCIHNKYTQYTHILCKQKLIFDVINRLTALFTILLFLCICILSNKCNFVKHKRLISKTLHNLTIPILIFGMVLYEDSCVSSGLAVSAYMEGAFRLIMNELRSAFRIKHVTTAS